MSNMKTTRAVLTISATGLLAYANSFDGAFVFDDKHLLKPGYLDYQPLGFYLEGLYIPNARRLLLLSMSVCHSLGGLNTFLYHAINLLVHILSAVTLNSIVRRLLLTERYREFWGHKAGLLAMLIACVFIAHPLNTESVTYIIQRVQAMMGLFGLLVVYALIRFSTGRCAWAWLGIGSLCAALSMDSKPHIVALPVALILIDRAFLSGSFRNILTRTLPFHLGIAVVWIIGLYHLAPLLTPGEHAQIGSVAHTAGTGGTEMSRWEYARSQPGVILHYIRLCFLPFPLSIDYAWPVARDLMAIAVPTLILSALGIAVLVAVLKNSAWGVLGGWFFLMLAPTSTIIARPDLAVEHRMYMPLISFCVAAVIFSYLLLNRIASRSDAESARRTWQLGALLGATSIALLCLLTLRRNLDYASPLNLWTQTVQVSPDNSRAWTNLGYHLQRAGLQNAAKKAFERALELNPGNWEVRVYFSGYWLQQGQPRESLALLEQAITPYPKDQWNLIRGNAYLVLKEYALAETCYRNAIEHAKPRANGLLERKVAAALVAQGRLREGIELLEVASIRYPGDLKTARFLEQLRSAAER